MIVGFVGTGAITAAMVTGFRRCADGGPDVIVSPRNRGTAEMLAGTFDRVTVAEQNQSVVDGADVVVLAIRPQVAPAILAEIRPRPRQKIVSLIATIPRAYLMSALGECNVVRAIPLPFAARGLSGTAIFPPDPDVAALFSRIGQSIEVDVEGHFDGLLAASALMGTYFGSLQTVCDWLTGSGLSYDDSRTYLRMLYQGLADVLASSDDRRLDELRHEFSTRGGINEQLFHEFERSGGARALTHALDAVALRIRAGAQAQAGTPGES